jgi:hypothetical protein
VNIGSGYRCELHVSLSPEISRKVNPVQFTQLDVGCRPPSSSSSSMDHPVGSHVSGCKTMTTATLLTTSPHRHHLLQEQHHMASPHMHGTMFRIQPDLTQSIQPDYHMMSSSNSPALTALSSVESNELIPLTTIVHGAPNRYFLRSSSSTTSGSHSHLEQDPG